MIAELTTATGAAACVVLGFICGAASVLLTLMVVKYERKDSQYR